jgi:protein involved in polysaccharide export with SLBB domain
MFGDPSPDRPRRLNLLNREDEVKLERSKPSKQAIADYRVGAGDWIRVFTNENPKGRVYQVRSDGRISLGESREVRVDGATIGQIERSLAKEAPESFAGCRVDVAVFDSQFIEVFGLDRGGRPQAFPYRGKETVEEFLSRAGCLKCKRGYRVRIVRQGSTIGAAPTIIPVKIAGQSTSKVKSAAEIYVVPHDYVYVEKDIGRGSLLTRITAKYLPNGKAENGPSVENPMFADSNRR